MPAAGYLVLADTFYPGWKATVDGEPAPVQRADHALRAVWLPAGEHEVVFSYHPAGRTAGTIVTVLSALVIAGLAAAGPIYRRRRASARL